MSHKSKEKQYSPRESDCVVDWVRNPESNKWIEVGGSTWNRLYEKYADELEKVKKGHTRGKVGKDGVCRVKIGDPPRGGAGGGRSSGGNRSSGGGGGGRSSGGGGGGGNRGSSPSRGTNNGNNGNRGEEHREGEYRGNYGNNNGGRYRNGYEYNYGYGGGIGFYPYIGGPYYYNCYNYDPYNPYCASPSSGVQIVL
jgi:hypothetical protein